MLRPTQQMVWSSSGYSPGIPRMPSVPKSSFDISRNLVRARDLPDGTHPSTMIGLFGCRWRYLCGYKGDTEFCGGHAYNLGSVRDANHGRRKANGNVA